MKVPTLRRPKPVELPGITARARIDRDTKNLLERVKPGEIAIVDHPDLDRVVAETLVARGVAAVVNTEPSMSGRYPILGPQTLVQAGIPLLDAVGQGIFESVREGDSVRLDAEALFAGERELCRGTRQTVDAVAVSMEEARAGLATQMEAFADTTMEFLKRERELLIDGVGVPTIRTALAGRHVLVVVRGYRHREDLAALRPYIREFRPVLLAVDGGAEALREAGYVPDLIVGDMGSVSDEALTCGAELVVHAYRDGRAPGQRRCSELGLDAAVFPATGTSEDIALLLADDKDARLVVAVGTHATLDEFLDKGRAGMASTFLTRLRVGSKLVDAQGVRRLYRSRISAASLLVLVVAAVVTVGAAVAISPFGGLVATYLAAQWDVFVFWLAGLFS